MKENTDVPKRTEFVCAECGQVGQHENGCEESQAPPAADDYVAWLRFRKNHDGSVTPITCDSDSTGAFKVYRKPDALSLAADGLAEALREIRDHSLTFDLDEIPCIAREALDTYEKAKESR